MGRGSRALKEAGEIGAAATAVFFILGAAGHVGPFPTIGAKGPRYAGKFLCTSGDIGLKGSEGIGGNVAILVEDQAPAAGSVAQFRFDHRVITLPIASGEGDDCAGSGAARGFGDIGGEAEIGWRPHRENEVGAVVGQVDAIAAPLHDEAVGNSSKKAGGLTGDGSIAVRSDEASGWKQGMRVEKPATLSASDIEDHGWIGSQILWQVCQKKVIHHRAGFFVGQFRQGAQIGRKRQEAAIEEAFPGNRRETVKHFIGGKVEEVGCHAAKRRQGGMAKTEKVGHVKTPATGNRNSRGTSPGLRQTTAGAGMQGAASCG